MPVTNPQTTHSVTYNNQFHFTEKGMISNPALLYSLFYSKGEEGQCVLVLENQEFREKETVLIPHRQAKA